MKMTSRLSCISWSFSELQHPPGVSLKLCQFVWNNDWKCSDSFFFDGGDSLIKKKLRYRGTENIFSELHWKIAAEFGSWNSAFWILVHWPCNKNSLPLECLDLSDLLSKNTGHVSLLISQALWGPGSEVLFVYREGCWYTSLCCLIISLCQMHSFFFLSLDSKPNISDPWSRVTAFSPVSRWWLYCVLLGS